MKKLLIVGCGDVARRAMPWLLKRFRVYALVRSHQRASEWRELGARPVVADLDDRRSLKRVAGIAELVLHFAPPPNVGKEDKRTAALLAALASGSTLPQRIVYISTTGVYGDCGGAWVDECHALRPATARARRRVDAELRLRRFNRAGQSGVCLLRAPGIYAAERLPVARLERGDPVLVPEEDVYTNHIHAEDLARLACLAIYRGRAGRAYNAVDSTDLRMGDYFDLAADLFGYPRPQRLRREELAGRLSPMALSFMSESRRLRGERILREFRVRLIYPTVNEGLAEALALQSTGVHS